MKKSFSNNEFEYFENAPIILSILQFRYKLIENFDNQSIKKRSASLSSEYPEIKERFVQRIHFGGNKPEGITNVSLDDRVIDGVQFISKSKKKILVIGKDRFTFEMHGEYEGWDSFSTEAKMLWNLFQNELSGVILTGISLRYVNRINLPTDLTDLSKYFTTFIQSSSGEHIINNFQLKYASTEPDNNLTIHVGHVLESPIGENYPYLFDIDIIYLSELQNEEDIIWSKFEMLRNKKNFIFNDGLTETTKKIIR
ncbi:hypothetical protein ES708_21697 [subsurface metagenome]